MYVFFLRRKLNHYSKAISRLPLSHLDITKRDMGRRIYSLHINEMVRLDAILEKNLKPQENSQLGCGDPGWGKEGGKVEHVHFNTSIAKSYYVLEKTALSRRPGLRQKDSRTIREYVGALKKAFPSLKQSLCDGSKTATRREKRKRFEQVQNSGHSFLLLASNLSLMPPSVSH